MRSGNSSMLAGLVLLFLLAHFLLLAGILIRIVATSWRQITRARAPAGLKILCRSSSRSTTRVKDQEAAYEANRMQLL